MAPEAPKTSAGPGRWIVPSLGTILGLVALVNALLFRSGHFFSWDGDVGRHIRVGRTILDSGAIPQTDLFSHTRGGSPFVPYEWLSEALTALVETALGLPGVVVMSALLYAIAVLAVYRTADELGARRVVAFLVALLGLLLQSVHLLPRPHLFTTAFAAVFVLILVRFARSGRAWTLAPLPLLMLVWANSHGGFLIGFILLAAFLAATFLRSVEYRDAGRARRPLLLVLVACGVASLLNPVGAELWVHTTGYLDIRFLVDATQEYRSVDFHAGYGRLFFACLFAGPVVWMTGKARVSPLAGGLYLFFAATALHSARNIPLFAVASLPWLAVWVDQFLLARVPFLNKRVAALERIDRSLLPGSGAVLGLSLLWFALGPNREAYQFDSTVFPVELVSSLDSAETSGAVFNQMIYGGYLLYERPGIPVFIDGQTDFYGEELSREYIDVLKGRRGWREVLDRYDVRWTLVANGEPINQLLDLDPGWELHRADHVATVYRRVTGE